MAGIFSKVLNDSNEPSSSYEPTFRESRKRRKEISPFKTKSTEDEQHESEKVESSFTSLKYGISSVCGNRSDMEDAITIYPSFLKNEFETGDKFHYFAVYDGHGCSHAAMKCKKRLHQIVKEELEFTIDWKSAMERSFLCMEKEVINPDEEHVTESCRCNMKKPQCDLVGTTALVAILTPTHIIVANCGDSKAILSRSGKICPLSFDHKPDRPDELKRINDLGGQVFNSNGGARVSGLLAMSRAIGDKFLKPYVISEPDVIVIKRSPEDECLILASDGLWDMVSNDTACSVAHAVLRELNNNDTLCEERAKTIKGETSQCDRNEERGSQRKVKSNLDKTCTNQSTHAEKGREQVERKMDKACTDASILLMRLALARNSNDNISVIVLDLNKD